MAETNIEIKLKNVRGSFLNVFKPQKHTDEKTGNVSWSYNGAWLLDKVKDKDQIKVLQDAMLAARDAKWPGAKKQIKAEHRCLRDGEPIDPDTIDPEKPGSGERTPLYDGYAGMMVLNSKRGVAGPDAPNPLTLIGPRKGKDGKFVRVTEADGLIYSGGFYNVIVRIYGYDGSKHGYSDRLNCSLEAIQFKAHGEPFGAKGINAESAFDEEEGEDDIGGSTDGEDEDPLG